ncbi:MULTISPECIES: polysaccharide biosynthesis/export family protein [unclassified Methylobacterium]|uniref:polysaccharide biosynthesis/export family protein n=1 Tax=unclassified Methylobacterium TaxID=2615210 RepID=UPI00226A3249|nr:MULTISPECIES: polysaccharide biosynthesis/export family protein [unclassified Methylobacterium]
MRRFGIPRRLAAGTLTAVIGAGAFWPSPSGAAYLLDAGDVLEVSVFGVADYRRRVTVNVDGDVSLPIVGEVAATGLSLADLRKRVGSLLADSKTLRAPDVTVELVEHRPFYVTGDVARPGAVPFRPGLTARVAVALAGGYDALRFRSENPLLAAPDLRSQYESLWMELVRRHARALTLQAEMDGRDEANLKALDDAPLAKASIRAVADVELKDLRSRVLDHARQRAFLERSLAQAQANVAGYEAAAKEQGTFIDRQVVAVDRLQTSFSRGISPVMRLEEENRSMASLRNQQLETTAKLAQARKERDEIARALERLADERRHRLLGEAQDAFVEVERLRSAVRAASEKLLYTGAVKAQMKRGAAGPELVLHRKVDGRPTEMAVTEEDDIQPGDVLDVVIRPGELVAAPGAKEAMR